MSEPMTDEQLSQSFPGQDVAHVRAMMDKMDGKGAAVSPSADQPQGDTNGTTADTPAEVQYPAWIPEKFRQGSVEEAMQKLAESYSVIERARGAAPDADDGVGADGDTGTDSGDNQQAPVHLDLRSVEAEYIENGGNISEETYAKAAEKGMSRGDLDNFIAGQKALADALITRVHAMAGGEEQYSNMLRWAEKSLPPAEVTEFDRIMGTGNEGQIAMAVRALKAAYGDANGNRPGNLLNGDGDLTPSGEGFQSKAEMTAAMKDARYKKDPAYRAMVERKIAAGNVW